MALTKEIFDELAALYVDEPEDSLTEMAKATVQNMIDPIIEVNKAQNNVRFNPSLLLISTLGMAKVACMSDGELQEKERKLVEALYSDYVKAFPDAASMDDIYDAITKENSLADETYQALKLMCSFDLDYCANVVELIIIFLAIDGNIEAGEKRLLEEYLPELTEGYDGAELIDAIRNKY